MRDPGFRLLFLAGTLGWVVYYTWEILLPVSLTAGHGVALSVWGVLFTLNAVVVTFFQLRVTHWTASIAAERKITAGLLLMGAPFLLLLLDASIPTLVVLALVFVVGEMLRSPASMALRAELAPADLRGAYLGALAASTFVANGLTPAIGFRVGDAAGETAMWLALLATSAAGAALYTAACRRTPAQETESPREPAVAA